MECDNMELKVSVDTEELEKARDIAEELADQCERIVPNITIRNNKNVYVTINNWNKADVGD